MTHAVIDIGTNTVILLIAKPKGKAGIEVVLDKAVITRLGQGLTENHFFSPEAMKRTRAALSDFAALCKQHKVKKIVAVATAACRNSANTDVFLNAVKKECGLKIEVISGEQEAEYAFRAAYQDFSKYKKIIVVDIGGGSTEIITGPAQSKKGGPEHLISLPIGSVRLTEQFVRSDPIISEEFHSLQRSIRNTLSDELDEFYPENFNSEDYEIVATAGTATTLAAMILKLKNYKPEKVHGYKLRQEKLEKLLAEIAIASVRERQKMPGIEPLRADVILAGGLVLHLILKHFKKESVTISDRGLRYGVFYKKFLK